MAVDPELKALLDALVESQVKLAEGQARTDTTLARFQERTEAALDRLSGEVTRLAGRVDAFAETVLGSFTGSAARDR